MSASEGRYVPAAGRRAFTRLYDPVIALTMRERTFRGRLLEQVLAGLPAPVRNPAEAVRRTVVSFEMSVSLPQRGGGPTGISHLALGRCR